MDLLLAGDMVGVALRGTPGEAGFGAQTPWLPRTAFEPCFVSSYSFPGLAETYLRGSRFVFLEDTGPIARVNRCSAEIWRRGPT
jgi:hypothetical protein